MHIFENGAGVSESCFDGPESSYLSSRTYDVGWHSFRDLPVRYSG